MKTIIFFISIVFLIGCGDASENAAAELKEFSMDLVTMPNDSMAFFKYDMTTVTGIVIEKNPQYKHDSLKSRFVFKDGLRDGIQRKWCENGNLSWECNFKEGKKNGTEKDWNTLGQILCDFRFEAGKKSGIQKEWFINGQLKSEENYKLGEKHGNQRYWFKNGKPSLELNYANGNVDGAYNEWYESGQLKSEREYCSGKKCFIQKEWWPSGILKYEYDKNGIETRYVNGSDENGGDICFVFNSRGVEEERISIEEGLKRVEENEVSFFTSRQNGEPHYCQDFSIISRRANYEMDVYDAFKLGNSIYEYQYANSSRETKDNDIMYGIMIYSKPQGAEWFSGEGLFAGGYVDSLFYDNGQVKSVKRYSDSGSTSVGLNGLSEGWYENGERKYRVSYSNDKVDGAYKEWYSNGNPKYIWNFEDDNSKSLKKAYYRDGSICYDENKGGKLGAMSAKYQMEHWTPNLVSPKILF